MSCSSFIILLSIECDSSGPLLSFQCFPDGTPVASSICVGIQPKKENSNEASINVRDCLAESAATASSATLGADQARFKHHALFDTGTGFHRCRALLAHNYELGISLRWSSGLALTVARKKPEFAFAQCHASPRGADRVWLAVNGNPRRTSSPISIHSACPALSDLHHP